MDFATPEVRRFARTLSEWIDRNDHRNEIRAMGVNQPTGGATAVEHSLYTGLVAGIDQTNAIRAESTLITTDDGAELQIPTYDDTAVEAVVLAENAQAASQDVEVNSVELLGHKVHSRIVRISRELFNDGGEPFQRHVGTILGRRIGRKTNRLFIDGSGVGEPTGLLTAGALGVTAATTSSLAYGELLALRYDALNAAYQSEASWVMAPETLKVVRQIVDGASRPIFDGELLFGRPILTVDAMPQIGAAAKPILFAALGAYAIREVGTPEIRWFRETYAPYGQIGVAAIHRTDANLLDPQAAAYLAMAAS